MNDPKQSAIVVIMQRLHEADVSGTILSGDEDWCHLMIPMDTIGDATVRHRSAGMIRVVDRLPGDGTECFRRHTELNPLHLE